MKPIAALLFFTTTIFIALQSTAQEAHVLKSTNDPILQKLINEKKPVHFIIDQNAISHGVKFYEQPQPSKQTTANTSMTAAANFHLTKDINSQTDANPANNDYIAGTPFAILNNVLYFSANDGIHGSELWRSDGTDAGTYMVKDIQPGVNSSTPSEIIVANNKLYFATQPTISSIGGLWISDGTDAGTIQLLNFPTSGPGVNGSYYLTNVSGTVYFLNGGSYYPQVWKTNGAPQNTVMVKDMNGFGYAPILCAAANGNYYFTLYSDIYGRELWRSDGTNAGTFMVKDISTSTDFVAGPSQFTAFNNKLYFSDDADGNGRKLWYTDGTDAGTLQASGQDALTLSTDFNTFFVNMPFAILKKDLYFSASSASTGTELFKYNADNSFSLVKNITPGTDGGTIFNITTTGSFVAFDYQNINKQQYQLWATKGTADSTFLIKAYDDYSALFSNLTYSNGILYFTSNTSGFGNELWETKGNSSSTVLVKDIYVGSTSANPLYLTAFKNKLYFNAASKNSGTELWATDGSAANTNMVKEINSTASNYSGPNYFSGVATGGNAGKAIGNTLLFTAARPETGLELYASDGTGSGTSLFKDLIKGESGSGPQTYTAANGSVYFLAYTVDSVNNYTMNVFKVDSSRNLTQISYTTAGAYIASFAVTDNGNVFYTLYSSISPLPQLWKGDGTKDGNILMCDSLSTIVYPLAVKAVHNKVFFTVNGVNTGTELWVSDGTALGTTLVKDIVQGSASSNPYSLYAYNNAIYFGADDGSGNALWKSDGTNAGTIKLKAVQPYNSLFTGLDYNNFFCVSNNRLYLNATSADNGAELWRTNGTIAGTVLVKDITVGTGNSDPAYLTDVNGTLYFTIYSQQQLWKTNGSAVGTVFVKDISSSNYYNFERCVANGEFFFNKDQLLWVSDGTDAGTQPVNDAGLNGVSLVSNLAVAGNAVFFNGYSDKYSYELYAGDATKVLQSVSSNKTIKTSTFTASVLENPVRSVLTINVQSSKDQVVNIVVSDQQGRSIATQKVLINKGSNAIKVNAANWFSGVYFINLAANTNDQVKLQVLK